MSAAPLAPEGGPGPGGDPVGASDAAHVAAWGDAWSVPTDAPAGAAGEAADGRGGVRPHWRGVLDALDRLGPAALAERARRLGRAAGSLCPSSPDADGPAWRLDPVPLPLPAPEFAALEAGLIQRARLLEALLADVYGPQTVLADGTLPPALVFANPGFLRACRTDPAPGGPPLQALAFDLVRGPDRIWRVLADLTDGAPGAGYAREGRRLLARVLPEPFRAARPRRLGPFFAAWREALRDAAPDPPTSPGPRATPGPDGPTGVALLVPGPGGPHRADDALLSRALGCPPVHGRDLVVRGGGVSVRSAAGERPVRVLLRRVEGARTDPLELAPDGAAGVAGLLGAARAGAVRVVNGPGAGVVEAPAFAAFWPALCRRLLGESLRLPGPPTLWLADAVARERLGRQPARWRIRPALDPAAPALPASGAGERAALDAGLVARPWEFVAVGEVAPAVAPAWDPDAGGPAVRPIVLRAFAVRDGRGWTVMPGGMARLVAPGVPACRSLPGRVVAKDVWVLDPAAGAP